MRLGTYVDGRAVTYDEGTQQLSIGDAPIATHQLVAYDGAGQIAWEGPELRDWFYRLLGAHSAVAPAQPVRKSRTGLVVAIVAVAAVLSCGLCSCVALLGSRGDKTASSSSPSEAATGTVSSPGDGAESKPAGDTSVVKIGQPFKTENLEITVTKVETRDKVGGTYFESKPAGGGVYVAVQWKYKNISQKPVDTFFSGPAPVLLDPSGTEFSPDIGASGSFATEIDPTRKVLSDLNPGITVTAGTVFEVAKGSFNKDTWTLSLEGKTISLK